ncbi:helix-turn-helix transcriptional regulator, partial [Pseudomonas aeruginosa]|nr:helix-turn-helix transcriptional regulator [Pseudomonas aeruginosa]
MTEPTELPAALPRLPPQHLPRPRLHQPLLRGECRLRLLCAPAGSGKTVLLGECARRAPPGVQVVWLALGGEALDPATFRRRLAGALGLPEESEEAQLCRRLRNASALWLLLDDYPRHPDPALDACLDRLLSAASPRVGWWLASRRRPQCNLARLLLEGELLEVDGGLLAFDADEVAELLRLHGRSADAATAGALLERSGGWCAALRLRLLVGEETAGPLLQE